MTLVKVTWQVCIGALSILTRAELGSGSPQAPWCASREVVETPGRGRKAGHSPLTVHADVCVHP